MRLKSTVRERAALVIGLAMLLWTTQAAVAADDQPAERELGKVKVDQVNEISALAASRTNEGVLWICNDGDAGQLYAIRTTGKLSAMLRLPVRVLDVEEIALGVGPEPGVDYLYVGDIGDNDSRRHEIAVVRFAEPVLNGAPGQSVPVDKAERFRLKYPDGPHNAEAMFVDPVSRELYLVTKETHGASLYSVATEKLRDGTLTELTPAGRLGVDNVSAGAIAPDGSRILLRREDRGWLWQRAPGESVGEALQRVPQVVTVRGRRQGKNGEAVTFRRDSVAYYTLSEGKRQAICEFELPPSTGAKAADALP